MNQSELNMKKVKDTQKELETLFADVFYVIESESFRISSPLLEDYTPVEGETLKTVYQVMTPEGNIFEIDSNIVEEGTAAIIIDPISKKEYQVIF